jgi:hypothetical protein
MELYPILAPVENQKMACIGRGGATPDEQISGCTALIESGKHTGAYLAAFLNHHGSAFRKKGEGLRRHSARAHT